MKSKLLVIIGVLVASATLAQQKELTFAEAVEIGLSVDPGRLGEEIEAADLELTRRPGAARAGRRVSCFSRPGPLCSTGSQLIDGTR